MDITEGSVIPPRMDSYGGNMNKRFNLIVLSKKEIEKTRNKAYNNQMKSIQ